MLNIIPVVGWILDLVFKTSLAIPFWFIWTFCGLGEMYFYFLPQVYQSPPFLHCIGLFMVVPIVYMIWVPKIFSVSNNQTVGKKEEKEKLWR